MTILGMIGLDLDTTPANLFSGGTTGTIVAGAGRSGGNSLHYNVNASSAVNLASPISTLNVAWAYKATSIAGTTFFRTWDTGTLQMQVTTNVDGSLNILRANTTLLTTAAGAVLSGVWQHVEFAVTISATVGTVDVWINSVNVVHMTGQNTKNTTNSTMSQFTVAGVTTGVIENSDIIWGDARIGDRRVECCLVSGAGNYAQFTPSTGSNYQNVDEATPNDDTDYNDTVTVNAIDSFTHAAMAGSPSFIDAVAVQVRGKNTTTGVGSLAPHLRSGGVDSAGTALALNVSYQDTQTVYLTDPATGAAWANVAAVNAAEIGYKKTA